MHRPAQPGVRLRTLGRRCCCCVLFCYRCPQQSGQTAAGRRHQRPELALLPELLAAAESWAPAAAAAGARLHGRPVGLAAQTPGWPLRAHACSMTRSIMRHARSNWKMLSGTALEYLAIVHHTLQAMQQDSGYMLEHGAISSVFKVRKCMATAGTLTTRNESGHHAAEHRRFACA